MPHKGLTDMMPAMRTARVRRTTEDGSWAYIPIGETRREVWLAASASMSAATAENSIRRRPPRRRSIELGNPFRHEAKQSADISYEDAARRVVADLLRTARGNSMFVGSPENFQKRWSSCGRSSNGSGRTIPKKS
jgi:hypothetical protein